MSHLQNNLQHRIIYTILMFNKGIGMFNINKENQVIIEITLLMTNSTQNIIKINIISSKIKIINKIVALTNTKY